MLKEKVQRFSIRKLSVGAASVLIGLAFMSNNNDKVQAADEDNDAGADAAKNVATNDSDVTEGEHVDVVAADNVEDAAKKAPVATNEVTTLDTLDKKAATGLEESKVQTPAADTNKKENTDSTKDKAADTYHVSINVVNDADATGKDPVTVFDKYTSSPTYKKWIVPNVNKDFKDGAYVNSIESYYTIPGYKLMTNIDELTSQFKVENGNLYVNGKDVNVTLHYAPFSDIRVEYVNEANGDVISSFELPTWRLTGTTYGSLHGEKDDPVASRYEAAAITVPGYELVSDPIVDGQVGNDVQSKGNPNYTKIIFKYRKTMTNEDAVTTSKNGTGAHIAAADQWSTMPLGFNIGSTKGYKNTFISADESMDVEQRIKDVVDHYAKQGYTYVGMTGKPKNEEYQNYLYYGSAFYLIPNSPVTVNYVDEEGNKVADSETISFNHNNPNQANQGVDAATNWAPKGTWETKAKDVDGYYLKKVQGAEKGDFTAYNYITTYVYAKKVKGQVTYVDDTTKTTLATDPIAEGKPGDNITYTTADKIQSYLDKGYKLAGTDFTDGKEVYKEGENANNFTVHLAHDYLPIEPKNPGKPGQPINPNDPEGPKFPGDTDAKSLEKTITRTVDYVDENGKSLVDHPASETVTLSANGVLDKVTGEWKTPLTWNSSNFEAINTPSFPTYHVIDVTAEGNVYYNFDKTTGNVAATPVTHEDGDTKVIVHLSRNEVNGTVKYIDDTTGETLKNDDLPAGKIGSEITYTTADKIKNFEDKGYALKSSTFVDGKMHYQENGNNYEVHLVHKLVPVDPKHPGKPGEPINPNDPDGNSPKWPNETGEDSLTKVIKRTVNYVDENGNNLAGSVTQTATMTGAGVLDKVTGKWTTPLQWKDGNFEALETPSVPNYHVTKVTTEGDVYYNVNKDNGNVSSTKVTHENGDTTVTVYFAKDAANGTVKYIDDTTGKTLQNDKFDGKVGDKITYTTADKIDNFENKGYKLVKTNFKDGSMIFNKEGNNYEVHFVHELIPVDPKHPGKPGEPINPNDPEGPNWPTESGEGSLTKEITRTVNYVDENGNNLAGSVTQTATMEGAGVLDKVTGEWTTPVQWKDGSFEAIETPSVPNYHVDKVTTEGDVYYTVNKDNGNVSSTKVTHKNGNTVVNVQFAKDAANGTVKYIDDTTGKTLQNDKFDGKVGEKITYTTDDKIKNFENKGYRLVKTNFQDGSMIFNKEGNNYEVHLAHELIPVDPKNPGKPGEPINPNDPEGPKFPEGTDTKSLTKEITRTVNYVDGNGNKIAGSVTQTATMEGAGVLDKVTGEWNKNITWKDGNFKSITTPSVDGYHVTGVTTEGNLYYTVDKTNGNVSSTKVTHENGNTTVNVHFEKDAVAAQGKVTYIDDTTGKTLKSDDLKGNVGEKIDYTTAGQIKNYENKGYKLVSNNFNDGNEVFAKDGNNFEVHLAHDLVPVTPEKPGKPGEPINPNDPEGPKFPAGTDAKSLTKEITRTVSYVDDNGNKIAGSVTQKIDLNGQGVIDKVTGEFQTPITWNKGSFDEVAVPNVEGSRVTSVTTEGKIYYSVDNNGNVAKTEVNHENGNTEVTVHFTKNTPTTPEQPTPNEPEVPAVPETEVPNVPAPHGEDVPTPPSVDEEEDIPAPHGQDIPTDPAEDEEPETVMPHASAEPEAPKAEEETVKPHAAALPQTGAKEENGAVAAGLALIGLIGVAAIGGRRKRRN